MMSVGPAPLRRLQEWAVLAFAVTLPLGQAPPEIALGIGLAVLVLRTALGQRRPLLPPSPLNVFLLLWFLVAVVSMHNSVDLQASVTGLRKLLKWFGLYLLVMDTVDSPSMLARLLRACLLGLAIEVSDGLWQAATGYDFVYHRASHRAFETVRRVTGSFRHPADVSIYLVSVCPFAVALGLRGDRRWRWPLLGLSGFTIAMLLLCLNRAGILALVGSMAVLALLLRHWAPIALAMAGAAVQAATVPGPVREWSATMPTLLQKLAEPERLMYWRTALNMVQAHPWFGVGVNTFVKAYPAYRTASDPYGQIGPYAHNQYLHLAAELGLVGLAVFLALLLCVGVSLRRTLKARHDAPALAAAAAAVGAGLVAYLIMGCLESALFYGRLSLTFWLLIGLAMATVRMVDRPAIPMRRLLFIRTDRLGETLLNLPAVAALKAALPSAAITLLVHPDLQPLLEAVPEADQVLADTRAAGPLWWLRALRLARMLRPHRFDLALVSNPKKELHAAVWLAAIPRRLGYGRKWGWCLTDRVPDRKALGDRHEVEYNLDLVRALGLPAAALPWRFPPFSREQEDLRRLPELRDLQPSEPLIAVHPFSSNPMKRWPAERCRELIRRLALRRDVRIVVVGGTEEQEQVSEVLPPDASVANLVGRLTLRQLAALLQRARALVSNDSGPVHLAAAVGTRTVVLFGGSAQPASGPVRWGPWGSGHAVIARPDLAEISVDDVMGAVSEMLRCPVPAAS